MPKAPKSPNKSRHVPLHVQLDEDEKWEKYGKVSMLGRRQKSKRNALRDEDEDEVALDPKTSQRIFLLAKEQQDELEPPEEDIAEEPHISAFAVPHNKQTEGDYDEEEGDGSGMESGDDADGAEDIFQIDPEDIAAMDSMLPANGGERRTLADVIFARLESDDTSPVKKVHQDGDHPDPAFGLDQKVVDAYTKVGVLFKTYKSGPLPKLFKVIPSLPGWARILALTSPETWTPHACRAATRLFISNLKPPQAQLFLQGVLLDAVRQDIGDNKKLNVHYYEALKRSLFKPSAFFKGILFPLLENGCTLREAAIVASILPKVKIPALHSSAALLHIANMEYSGPNSLFIRVLIDKKYELPYKVLDALTFHFIRLSNTYRARTRGDTENLPVLWHQSLLAFCQRYACDLAPDQKDALLDVVRLNPHAKISPEVRRELLSSVSRGEPATNQEDVLMG